MLKYLKKIGVLSLLFSIAINNNFKAMNEIWINPKLKIEPIVREERHLKCCAEIADFEEDIESLKRCLALFLPDEAVGRFLTVQRLTNIGISGDYIQIHRNPRVFVSVLEVLDLMASFVASDKAKEFFESKDKEIIIKLSDFPFLGSFPPVKVKMSKIPVLFGKMHKYLSLDQNNKLISVPKMKIENSFFTKLTFQKLKNDFTFIIAQIEKQPVIFVKYRNICLSNLVRKQEVSEYKGKDNKTKFSYSNKVFEYNGKEFKSFIIDSNFHVFSIKKPISFENIIVEI